MAEPSSHINYSFEDIQRYLQGKMSATEMHDMEKAALQDPFLADAIEGFNETDFAIAKQHLNEINAGLFAKKKESKVVAFNKRTQWLNVAAVIIVLAGIGVVASYFLRTPSLNRQPEIAKVKKDETNKAEQQKPEFEKLDTSPPFTDTVLYVAQNKAVKKVHSSAAKKKAAKNITDDKTIVKEDQSALSNANIATLSAPPPDVEKTMMSRSFAIPDTTAYLQGKTSGVSVSPSLPSTFSGKVVDENGEPIAGVTIATADKKAAVITDMNGNFNLQKTDTLLNVTAGTVGYNSRSLALKQGVNDPIILNQANEALSEVVVTGYGTTRKKNAYTDSITRAQRNANGDSAMPVGGWSNFNHYVITQLNSDTTTNAITNPDDMIEMEFLVDKAGNPYDIKVTRSVNEQLSSKAVEILKNGPKWTSPTRKKKARVVISF